MIWIKYQEDGEIQNLRWKRDIFEKLDVDFFQNAPRSNTWSLQEGTVCKTYF